MEIAKKGPKITLAVMSDMHCRLSDDPVDSFLTVGSLRRNASHHPIEALITAVRKNNLRADALLVPGDLTNRSRLEGLSQAWDYALEIKSALRARHLIPVIGNHDIDSKRIKNSNPIYNAKFLRSDFPFADPTLCNQFLSDGCCAIGLHDGCQLILVNTVVDQTDEESAKRGTFGPRRIEQLDALLEGSPNADVRIALMHHHPLLHSSPVLTDKDVIPSGDRLLAVLRKHRCGLVIHGHKHHPRLTCTETESGKIVVFASGSFSAMLAQVQSLTGNLFHMVEVAANEPMQYPLRGLIFSWRWRLGTGWLRGNLDSAGLPFIAGFGSLAQPQDVRDMLVKLAESNRVEFSFEERRLLLAAPELPYLTPAEYSSLTETLRAEHGLQLRQNEDGEYWMGRLVRRGT